MLIRFSVENFLSFNNKTEVLLTPGKTRNFQHHILKGEKLRDINILKSSVFYGANASGKSNLIKAIHFAKQLIVRGSTNQDSINYQKFKLDDKALKKNSKIEFEFKYKSSLYAYGFEFNNKMISEEWLYEINNQKEKMIFERKTVGNEINISFGNLATAKKDINRLGYIGLDTNPNELFLHSSNSRNIKNIVGIKPIFDAYLWFDDILTVIFPDTKSLGLEVKIDSDKDLKEVFKWFLNNFNTGIASLETVKVDFFSKEVPLPDSFKEEIVNDIEIGETVIFSSLDNIKYAVTKNDRADVNATKLMTLHKLKNKNKFIQFEIFEESDGTQRIMDLIPALMELAKDEKVFIIDEIERSLHPKLTYKMLELFFNESAGMPSQLICTTHEDGLLTQKLLRKDEIWFVKKNAFGESTAYSLEEFKPRKDKDIRTSYLKGRFDAIPILTAMDNAPWKN